MEMAFTRDWLSILRKPYTTQNLQRKDRWIQTELAFTRDWLSILRTPYPTQNLQRKDRWIQSELAFTLAKNATKPNPFEIIPLQTIGKENNWKTEEALARAAVTLETERIKGSNPWCLWWWIIFQQDATYSFYYISVGSSTCFECWHPSSGAGTTVNTASGIDWPDLLPSALVVELELSLLSSNSTMRADGSRPSWPVPETIITVVPAPDDGCQHSKHVELSTEM